MDLAPKVIYIFAHELHVEPDALRLGSTFEELGLDSLAGVNILFALEEEFHIDIPDAVVKGTKSIGQVVAALSQVLDGKGFTSANTSAKGGVAGKP